MTPEFNIAVLLPTRGRAEMLERSIQSLVSLAKDPNQIQLMLAFDNDDKVGTKHFEQVVQPWLDDHMINYTAMTFDPLGYIRLNEYVNELARNSDARWLVFWNDDAVMQTQDWDVEIMKWDGQFKLLAFQTHNLHPYSIFPIVPRKWLDLLGYLSPHQISDAWLSQQAYMLDIMERIPVEVLHDRHDLTGNNKDETFLNRPMLEGNPNNPRDFNHVTWRKRRMQEAMMIGNYLAPLGYDLSHFRLGLENKIDIWEKMAALDKKGLMKQWKIHELDH